MLSVASPRPSLLFADGSTLSSISTSSFPRSHTLCESKLRSGEHPLTAVCIPGFIPTAAVRFLLVSLAVRLRAPSQVSPLFHRSLCAFSRSDGCAPSILSVGLHSFPARRLSALFPGPVIAVRNQKPIQRRLRAINSSATGSLS